MAVNTDPPIQLSPDLDKSQSTAFINENFRKISDNLSPFQISDGSNNILNIGKDSTGSYSMKVAKPGYDAFNAADANLIFNSNQNVFKIVGSGTANITMEFAAHAAPAYSDEAWINVIPHNLGYIPIIDVYLDCGGTGWSKVANGSLYTWVNDSTKQQRIYIYLYSTTTELRISFQHIYSVTSGSTAPYNYPNISIKYYLLQETAN